MLYIVSQFTTLFIRSVQGKQDKASVVCLLVGQVENYIGAVTWGRFSITRLASKF